MSELLHELENNEAILLMHIAGELPEDERREVEQLLGNDASLRIMHDDLRRAWLGSMEAVERVDSVSIPVASREAAVRQVGRMVRQWHAARMMPKPVPAAAPPRRLPWFRMSAAAAVFAFVGFLGWWSNQPSVSPPSGPLVVSQPTFSNPAPQLSLDSDGGDVRLAMIDLTGMTSPELPALESSYRDLEYITNNTP